MSYVIGRLKEFTLQDCLDVIDCMTYKWKGDAKMEEYLRPSTLFAPTKFVNYHEMVKQAKVTGEKPTQAGGSKNKTKEQVFREALDSRNKPSLFL